MTQGVERVLAAVREKQRIAIHGDYDCDGVLGTHILRSVLSSLGVQPRPTFPTGTKGMASVRKLSISSPRLVPTF